MSQRLELFQMLVTIPNASGRRLPPYVRHCLKSLEGAAIQLPGDAQNLITEGRKEYLHLLASRAMHFWGRSRPVGKALSTRTPLGLTPMEQEQARDFFHDAYYVVFYIARFALVTLGFYDCTSHDDYDEVLGGAADDKALSKAETDKLLAIKSCLSQQKPYRNDADYIFGNARLASLGNRQVLEDTLVRVDDLLKDWGIQ